MTITGEWDIISSPTDWQTTRDAAEVPPPPTAHQSLLATCCQKSPGCPAGIDRLAPGIGRRGRGPAPSGADRGREMRWVTVRQERWGKTAVRPHGGPDNLES